jgi:hypothetical protein
VKIREQWGITKTSTEEIGMITAQGTWRRKRKPKGEEK